MTEIAQPHGCPELVELSVAADELNCFGARYPEILHGCQSVCKGFVTEGYRTALYGMVHFCGVKAEYRSVAETCYASAVHRYPECVCRVVYDLQPVFCGYAFRCPGVAHHTVYVYGKYGGCFFGDESFQLGSIERHVVFAYVTKNRAKTAA